MSNTRVIVSGKDIRELYKMVPQLVFEVTEECNFKCMYCAYGDNYIQPELRPLNSRRYMSWATARILLDEFLIIWREQQYETTNVRVSFYGGEPLLNFSLIEQIVSYIETNKPNYINILYNITTNGYFLKKYLPYLKKHDFMVAVSLDGNAIANGYRRFRNGKETFSVVKKNLDYIYETDPDFFHKNISFQSVLNNHSSIIDVLDFFDENYHTTTEISSISKRSLCLGSRIEEYYRDFDLCMEEDFQNRSTAWEKLKLVSPRKEKVKSCFKRISSSYYYTYLDFFKENKSTKSNGIICETCLPFSCRLFLSVIGNIYPCERVFMSSPLGRITNEKVEIDFDEVANKYSKIYNTANRFCHSCIKQKDCTHCFLKDGGLFDDGVRFCPDYKQITAVSTRECEMFIKENVEEFKSLFK